MREHDKSAPGVRAVNISPITLAVTVGLVVFSVLVWPEPVPLPAKPLTDPFVLRTPVERSAWRREFGLPLVPQGLLKRNKDQPTPEPRPVPQCLAGPDGYEICGPDAFFGSRVLGGEGNGEPTDWTAIQREKPGEQ